MKWNLDSIFIILNQRFGVSSNHIYIVIIKQHHSYHEQTKNDLIT